MAEFQPKALAPVAPYDPIEDYNAMLKGRYLKTEIDKAKRVEDENTAYNNALRTPGALKGDGTFDDAVISNAMINGGRGAAVPAFQKSSAEIAELRAKANASKSTANKDDMEALTKALAASKTRLAGVSMTDPSVGIDQIYQHAVEDTQDPTIRKWIEARTPGGTDAYLKGVASELHAVQQNPSTYQSYAMSKMAGAEKAADTLKQSFEQINLGDHVKAGSFNAYNGKFTPTSDDPKKMAAGANTTINLPATKTESAYDVARAKLQAPHDDALFQAADNAPHAFELGNKVKNLVASGAIVGAGADLKINATAAMKALGFNVNDDQLANSQLLRKYIAQNYISTMQQFKAAGITRVTNLDVQIGKDGSPQIDMSPQALITLANEIMQGAQEVTKRANNRRHELPNPGVGNTDTILGTNRDLPVPVVPPTPGTAKTHQDVAKEFGF